MDEFKCYSFLKENLVIPVRLDVYKNQSETPYTRYALLRELNHPEFNLPGFESQFIIDFVRQTPELLGKKFGSFYEGEYAKEATFSLAFNYDSPIKTLVRNDECGLSLSKVINMNDDQISEFERSLIEFFIDSETKNLALNKS